MILFRTVSITATAFALGSVTYRRCRDGSSATPDAFVTGATTAAILKVAVLMTETRERTLLAA
jgi:hypothetical protein